MIQVNANMPAPISQTYAELLFEQAARTPEHPALICRGGNAQYGSVSYQQLAMRAQALAAAMYAYGLRRGHTVATFISNRIEFLEVLFAASTVGASLAPFSTWSTRSELEFLLRDSQPCMLFSLAALGERNVANDFDAILATHDGPKVQHLVLIAGKASADWLDFDEFSVGSDAAVPRSSASANDVVATLYTSGSSSRPKAVPMEHAAAIENGYNIGERLGLGAEDKVFLPVPMFWSYAAVNALPATMSHGATLVMQERFDAKAALSLIESHRCSAIYTLPAITNALLAAPEFSKQRTQSLRTGLTIGSAQDLARAATELGAHAICNIYGSTETYGNCCVTPHDWPLERRMRSQGPPLPGVSLRIRDVQSGQLCAQGVVGQIEVNGYLTRGYSGDSAQFNDTVFCEDGFFRSGDLGSLDEKGCLVYAGRSSEMIKRSGINVSPAEVEEILQQHPSVAMVGVTAVADAKVDEAIVAFVVLRGSAQVTTQALIAHCKEYLSVYKLPDQIEFCDALPLTPTGKLMRKELKLLAAKARANG